MAKIKTKYVCQECGYETSKWLGKCPECMKWNTLVEEIEQKGWSLVPSKYIEFEDRDEHVDFDEKMKELQAEMTSLLKQEAESKDEVINLFKSLGYEIKL